MSLAGSSQEENVSCVYCNDDKGKKKKNCIEFPNTELSSQGGVCTGTLLFASTC